jgi:prevent-host-death family protein
MKSIGIREAKPRLSALVRAAKRGEVTTITDYGKPVAQIAPLEAPAGVTSESGQQKSEIEVRQSSDTADFLGALLKPPFDLDFDF